MQLDPVLIAETQAWFRRAAEDLRAAELLFTASPPLLGAGVFHCQQAAEKALKGFLTWNSMPFRKTHDIEEVGRQCIALDSSLQQSIAQGVILSDYAWKFRYPGGPGEPSEGEARDALVLALHIYEAALNRLPPEVRLEQPR